MELADVEVVAELLLCVGAQSEDLEAADQVGRCLSRRGRVTIDLGRYRVEAFCRVLQHVVDRFVAGPAHDVDARVDDQSRRAECFIGQHAEAR